MMFNVTSSPRLSSSGRSHLHSYAKYQNFWRTLWYRAPQYTMSNLWINLSSTCRTDRPTTISIEEYRLNRLSSGKQMWFPVTQPPETARFQCRDGQYSYVYSAFVLFFFRRICLEKFPMLRKFTMHSSRLRSVMILSVSTMKPYLMSMKK